MLTRGGRRDEFEDNKEKRIKEAREEKMRDNELKMDMK